MIGKCKKHDFELRNCLVAYPHEIGGMDVYEMARKCKICGREEILMPFTSQYISKDEFEEEYNCTTKIL